MDIYAENIMDHYKNPRHRGEIADFSARVHEVNTTCGDEVFLDVKIQDGVLVNAAFRGEGCAISQAGASILLDEVIGFSLEEILGLSKKDIVEMMGVDLTARRMKCAVLALLALKNAIMEFRKAKEIYSFADLLVE
jgi:nitrogen fixation NifU-like protein